MQFAFDKKLFISLSLAFILFTVIGTLSHELGHYFVARILGYEASINYASTHYDHDRSTSIGDSLLITMGGPLQTMIFGSIGVILVIWNKKKYMSKNEPGWKLWLGVLLSLFWLRELFNFLLGLLTLLFARSQFTAGDEIKIAMAFSLPILSVSMASAILATGVLCLMLYVLPKKVRFTFLAALCFGGIMGYLIWLKWLGPVLLP